MKNLFELPEKMQEDSDFNGVYYTEVFYSDEVKDIVNNFDSIKNLLNKNIDRLIKLLNIIEKWFKRNTKYVESSINLKLHHVYCNIKNDWELENFNLFCTNQYDYFCEFLKNLELKEEYIGRTSSFRIVSDDSFKINSIDHDLDLIDFMNIKKSEQFKIKLLQIFYNTDDVINEIDDYNVLYIWDFNINDIKKYLNEISITDIENEYQELIDDEEIWDETDGISYIKFIRSLIIVFNCLNNNLIDYLKEIKTRIKNINKAYEYVNEFKDNQLTIWNNWLDGQLEFLEYKHEEEKEQIPEAYTVRVGNYIFTTINPKNKNLFELRKEIFDVVDNSISLSETFEKIIKLDSNYKIACHDIYSSNDIKAEKNTLTFT